VLAAVGFLGGWCPALIRSAMRSHDPLLPEWSFAVSERAGLGILYYIEVVIGPEVDQFFFGKFMWRHVAAKGLACGQCPGVD
jgi:hypothetical protein